MQPGEGTAVWTGATRRIFIPSDIAFDHVDDGAVTEVILRSVGKVIIAALKTSSAKEICDR